MSQQVYKDMIQRLEIYQLNLRNAIDRGDKPKERKYQTYINELKNKMRKYEAEVPQAAFVEISNRMEELVNTITLLNKTIAEKEAKVSQLELELDIIRNPEKYNPKPIEPETDMMECPSCHRVIKKMEMGEHQKNCIKHNVL